MFVVQWLPSETSGLRGVPLCRLRDAGAGWKPQNKGISKDSSHMRARSACVDMFEGRYKPLQHRSIWSHPNGFMLLSSPFLDGVHSFFAGLAPEATC